MENHRICSLWAGSRSGVGRQKDVLTTNDIVRTQHLDKASAIDTIQDNNEIRTDPQARGDQPGCYLGQNFFKCEQTLEGRKY